MKSKLTLGFKQSIARAKRIAKEMGHLFITGEHVLLGILELEDSSGINVLKKHNVNIKHFQKSLEKHLTELNYEQNLKNINIDEISCSPKLQKTLVNIKARCDTLLIDEINTGNLLLEIITDLSKTSKFLKIFNIDPEEIQNYIYGEIDSKLKEPQKHISPTPLPSKPTIEDTDESSLLEQYAIDITMQAATGQLDDVIGREEEIDRAIQILMRRSKNNPILIGDAGVGKTAVVEGLAQQIVDGNVPDELLTTTIYSLDLPLLLAGTKYRGEFEQRMKDIINIVKSSDIILFIDEIHMISGAGSAEGNSMDVGNILKPALSRGQITCIGATTFEEYKECIECDSALDRRFQTIPIDEPTIEDTKEILKKIKYKYETFHNVSYSHKIINNIVDLSDRYILDRNFPDKAIDILDEIGARAKTEIYKKYITHFEAMSELTDLETERERAVRKSDTSKINIIDIKINNLIEKYTEEVDRKELDQKTKRKITELDVSQHMSYVTGIPVTNLEIDEKNKLKKIKRYLSNRIIGQEHAIEKISQTIRRNKTGLSDEDKPISSFLFLGSTGTGKTHSAKILAEYLFNTQDSFIHINMSEMMESHSISKLIGSPPGYVGYGESAAITDCVRRNPYSIVLFDEIEKAHPDVVQILLQILEEGMLTDSSGRNISFKNCIVILTSNVGSDVLEKNTTVGFMTNKADESYKMKVELKKSFRPEVINRIDNIITFNKLSQQNLISISKILLKKTIQKLRRKKITLLPNENIYEYIVDQIDDLQYGARPVRRVIIDKLESKISDFLINTKETAGISITIKRDSKNPDNIIIRRSRK